MNNEPVAWAYILDGGDFMDAIHPEEHNRHKGRYTTPLYTHPAKTLTDRIAELEKLVSQRFDDGKRLGIIETEDRFLKAKTLTDEEILTLARSLSIKEAWITTDQTIEFARAILRKANEK